MKNRWHSISFYNLGILLYVSGVSFLLLSFKMGIKSYFLLWFIVDEVAFFIHVPIIIFLYQCYLKYKGSLLKKYSLSKLFLNAVLMSIISYIVFYLILFFFFYKGEVINSY